MHVIAAEALVLHHDAREDIFRLAQRQSQRRLQQPFPPIGVEIHGHVVEAADLLDDFIQQDGQFFAPGQRRIHDRDLLLQLGRDLEHRRHQHDGLVAVLQMDRDLLQTADGLRMISAEAGVEILEDEDRRIHLLNGAVQGGHGIGGLRVARLSGLQGHAGGDQAGVAAPFDDRFLATRSNLDQGFRHASLLAREHIQDWIPRPDERFDLFNGGGFHGG